MKRLSIFQSTADLSGQLSGTRSCPLGQKMYGLFTGVFCLWAGAWGGSGINDFQYLGQEPPGEIPQLFAPGHFRHLAHSSPTFSPDGKEILWSTVGEGKEPRKIYRVNYQNGAWSRPEVSDFSGQYHDDQPFISHDGQRLFFASKRPVTPGGKQDLNLWFCRRIGKNWSEPTLVRGMGMWTPSLSKDNTLYFTDIISKNDSAAYPDNTTGIFRSECISGTYQKPELLPEVINGKTSLDWTPFIAPDERYLIFSSHRKGGYGQGDLYISFRDEAGKWDEPVNLGPSINTEKQERFPGVSPDGKYLFFTRWVGPPHYHDLYWVSADVIYKLSHSAYQTIP